MPDVTKIVTDLLVRYCFQLVAAVAILAAGLLCARIARCGCSKLPLEQRGTAR